MNRASTTLLGIVVLAAAAGCSSPNPRYYTLGAPVPAAATAPATRTVWVGPVTVPARVDRPQIVLAVAPNEVRFDEFSRWAEPLADGIAAALVAQLATRLPATLVRPYGEGGAADPAAVQVRIDVQRFDTAPDEQVLIEAVWTVYRPGTPPRPGASVVREPTAGSGIDAAVAAHGRALARLSDDIAAAIRLP